MFIEALFVQAVVLEFVSSFELNADVEVATVGFDGLLPKLDLYMLAEHCFRSFAGASTALPGPSSIRELLEPLAESLRRRIPTWASAQLRQTLSEPLSALPAGLGAALSTVLPRGYAEKLSRTLGFVGAQGGGTAGGAHAAFKSLGIDAVTVRLRPDLVRYEIRPDCSTASQGNGNPRSRSGSLRALLRMLCIKQMRAPPKAPTTEP